MSAHTSIYKISVTGLAPLITNQLAVRRDRQLIQRHRKKIRRFYAPTPDLARAFKLAPIKGRAS